MIYVSILLPVTSKVHNYLVANYGEVITLNRKDYLLKHISMHLEKPSKHFDSKSNQDRFCHSIKLLIPEDMFFRLGHVIPMTSVAYINSYINKLIHDQLYLSIDITKYVAPTTTIKSIIEAFCNRFDLDPDVFKYDSLKRSYLRHRNLTYGDSFPE